MLTDSGDVEVELPRDRDGSFEPVIVAKRQRRLSGIDEIVLSLYARGLTTGDIAAHFAAIYDVSKDTISRITARVMDEMVASFEAPDGTEPATTRGSYTPMACDCEEHRRTPRPAVRRQRHQLEAGDQISQSMNPAATFA